MSKSDDQGTEMFYLVHKEGESHGFLTTCPQMAYEVRKGADSNTYFGNGTPCPAAVKFCEEQDVNANYEITEFTLSELNVGLIVPNLREVSNGLVCDYKGSSDYGTGVKASDRVLGRPDPTGLTTSDKEYIKELALASGFKLKEQDDGRMDLNPYVYEFAKRLLTQAK